MRAISLRLLRHHVLAVCAASIAVALNGAAAPAQPKPAPKPQQQTPQQQTPQSSGPNALQGFSQNRDQPVKIKADGLQVNDHTKVATFSGNVHLVQGDTTLRCKTLTVYYDGDAAGPSVKSENPGPGGSQQIRRMVAAGGVLVSQKDQTATGDTADYDMPAHTVTLSAAAGSSVTVTQGPNIMKGASLTVDLTSSVTHLKGGANGVMGLLNPSSTKAGGGDTKSIPDTRAAPKAQPGNPKGLY